MRECWDPAMFRKAAKMLEQAAANLDTSYPHSKRDPEPIGKRAALALIRAAHECIAEGQPTPQPSGGGGGGGR